MKVVIQAGYVPESWQDSQIPTKFPSDSEIPKAIDMISIVLYPSVFIVWTINGDIN